MFAQSPNVTRCSPAKPIDSTRYSPEKKRNRFAKHVWAEGRYTLCSWNSRLNTNYIIWELFLNNLHKITLIYFQRLLPKSKSKVVKIESNAQNSTIDPSSHILKIHSIFFWSNKILGLVGAVAREAIFIFRYPNENSRAWRQKIPTGNVV